MPANIHIAREGVTVRKQWFAAWALAVFAAGCAGPNGTGGYTGLGSRLQAKSTAPTQPRLVERIKAPFAKHGVLRSAGAKSAATASSSPTARPTTKSATDPSPELYISMAEMSQRGGNTDQARVLYQKALALNPNHVGALLSAAHMEDRIGRLDIALPLYERATTVDANNATALNDLALCLARKGDLTAAHGVLEQAVKLEPRKELYRNNIAKVLVEMNWTDQAVGHLSAVHSPAVAHYNMGVLLAQRGRHPEAMRYLLTASAIDPSMEPAQKLMAELSAPGAAPGQPSILQTARLAPTTRVAIPNESILPTPQIAATVPVATVPVPTPTVAWPSRPAVAPLAPVAAPAPTTAPSDQPTGLPPVE